MSVDAVSIYHNTSAILMNSHRERTCSPHSRSIVLRPRCLYCLRADRKTVSEACMQVHTSGLDIQEGCLPLPQLLSTPSIPGMLVEQMSAPTPQKCLASHSYVPSCQMDYDLRESRRRFYDIHVCTMDLPILISFPRQHADQALYRY